MVEEIKRSQYSQGIIIEEFVAVPPGLRIQGFISGSKGACLLWLFPVVGRSLAIGYCIQQLPITSGS